MLKAKELREHSLLELDALLKEKREQLYKLGNGLASNEEKSVSKHEIPRTKTQIARILTVMREKKCTKCNCSGV